VLAGQVSVGRREAAAVGVDAAYALTDVSQESLATLAERVARRWGR
jgi:glycerate kinase